MTNWEKILTCLLAAALCFSLAACGGSDGKKDVSSPPESFEGMVKNSSLVVGYSMYKGVWSGEGGKQLIVEADDNNIDAYFVLYDADDNMEATGYIQPVLEYSADYFYNENDGIAHHSWFDEDRTLHIDTFGTFTYSGPVENDSDPAVNEEFTSLAGTWYLDGDAAAESILCIEADGSWSLYERSDGDGDPNQVDGGTISRDSDDETIYYAASTMFDDAVYEIFIADSDIMYWGGEADCYQRAS